MQQNLHSIILGLCVGSYQLKFKALLATYDQLGA